MAQVLDQSQVAFIQAQFNGTTYQPNSMDVQSEPLYDELTTAAGGTITPGTSGTPFFSSPTGKSYAQTNVTEARKLPAPEAFAVMAIKFYPQPNVLLADWITIGANFALEFWIGQKEYNRAPCQFYNAGLGPAGFTTFSSQSFITNGQPGRHAAHALEINIVIDNQASFYGLLSGTSTVLTATGSGGTGAVLYMLLDGLHARGVQ
jgi:hypothetical protein